MKLTKITDTENNFMENEVRTPTVGYFWKGLALFLLGVVVGFMFAPIKKGVKIGNNSGNNNGNNNVGEYHGCEDCCVIDDDDLDEE